MKTRYGITTILRRVGEVSLETMPDVCGHQASIRFFENQLVVWCALCVLVKTKLRLRALSVPIVYWKILPALGAFTAARDANSGRFRLGYNKTNYM